MTDYERKRIEMELKNFTSKHFEKPSACRNLDQIRFYVAELSRKISELESRCNYAPEWAYAMLAQYNARQNTMLWADFKKAYN
jgi:hypothetical protein